jgi:hypothetical protein
MPEGRVLVPLLGRAIFASAGLVFSGGGNGGPALNALGTIMLDMSFVIAVIGFLGYRWLTRGERGSRLEALTTIAGSEG